MKLFDPDLPFLTADGQEVFQFERVEESYRTDEYVYEGILEDGRIYGWDELGRIQGKPSLTLCNVVSKTAIAATAAQEQWQRNAIGNDVQMRKIAIEAPMELVRSGAISWAGDPRSVLSRAETDRLQDLVHSLSGEVERLRVQASEVEELRSRNEALEEQVETLMARFGLVG